MIAYNGHAWQRAQSYYPMPSIQKSLPSATIQYAASGPFAAAHAKPMKAAQSLAAERQSLFPRIANRFSPRIAKKDAVKSPARYEQEKRRKGEKKGIV
jgi:hypothetical protein